MTVQPDGISLAAEFPDPTRRQWRQLVEGVLRKAGRTDLADTAAEDALATELQDGLTVRPLYTAEDGAADPGFPGLAPFVRGGKPLGNTATGWDVRQRHAQPVAKRANEAVLADLENGVTSLWLRLGDGGLPVAGLPEALDGVHLDLAPVVLDAGADFEAAARTLLALAAERGTPPLGRLGADPLGHAARTRDDIGLGAAGGLAALCHREHPGVRAITVDALPYHEAGASPAQELGCSLATGVAYLRELTTAGLPVEAALGQLEFRYAATTDQFLTIATLRAARRLWARVAEVCGAPGVPQLQHAVTSSVMMTRRDPWVNMLRTTVACLGAGVGGADAVTVLPFDAALGLPDDFARRIARNTSAILMEESHLARVIDPAGGSWYVERLTDDLCRAAWDWFQEIERAGGQAAALRSGLVAERLAHTWEERRAGLAHRREPITGVSEFPNLAEDPVEREPSPGEPRGGLPRVRRDHAFEALRARSDAHLAATGVRPRVYLAGIGPAAARTGRTSFAANLFQAGGVEAVPGEASGFAGGGTTVACLCSSDALYAEKAEAVAAELRSAGAAWVFLAGRPGEYAGVDEYVFAGGDAIAVLTSVLDRLGVA
ncbi:methylmalonyl-CoA mutase subunit beta [Actinomadura sp. DC4]|uniref:methylmalonyl-CoA mutase subunit beta n=1 Tax=Actinomadura sp. DC4 TaxID=3055069 RepID=UPI0025B1DE22|nr:methylmalonyl-CoA mutase subunit beta [Actinomadura sp. DC4]MDN3359638.1 methylmalonyl-CoA mutase subunit beta [Actinomadura sp. DC4]